MILDSLLQFDSAINLAQVAGTYNSTNILDLHIINGGLPVLVNGQGARDIGIGDDNTLQLMVLVTTTFTGTTGTLQVNFQGTVDDGTGNPKTANWTTYASTGVLTLATLVAGARLMDQAVPRPPAGTPFPRFLRLTYVIGTATMTAGTIESFIVGQRFDQPEISNAVLSGYPAGITVSN